MPRKRLVELSESLISWASIKRRRRKRKARSAISAQSRNKYIYIATASLSFLLFFFITFPSEKITRGFLYSVKKQTKLLWQAEEMKLSLLFGPKIIAKNIEIAPGPNYRKRHWGNLSPMIERGLYINRIEFKPSILSLIPLPFGLKESVPAGDFDISIWGAKLSGYFAIGKKVLDIDMEVENLALRKLTPLYNNTGLDGEIKEASISFHSSNGQIESGSGKIEIKAQKIQLQTQRFVQILPTMKGLGILNLGTLDIETNINNGNAVFKTFSLQNKKSGFDLRIEGDLQLRSKINNSRLDFNVWLSPSKNLLPTLNDPIVQAFLPFVQDSSGNSYRLQLQGSLGFPKTKKR